jgi:hypothetical protein
MKLKIPIPAIEEIAGEVAAPVIVLPTSARQVSSNGEEVVSAQTASERMQALLKKGLGKRAIVCIKNTDRLNPMMWGIVYNAQPFSKFPLEVRMASGGGPLRSDGTDLEVVYPAMNANDLHAWLQGREQGYQ